MRQSIRRSFGECKYGSFFLGDDSYVLGFLLKFLRLDSRRHFHLLVSILFLEEIDNNLLSAATTLVALFTCTRVAPPLLRRVALDATYMRGAKVSPDTLSSVDHLWNDVQLSISLPLLSL